MGVSLYSKALCQEGKRTTHVVLCYVVVMLCPLLCCFAVLFTVALYCVLSGCDVVFAVLSWFVCIVCHLCSKCDGFSLMRYDLKSIANRRKRESCLLIKSLPQSECSVSVSGAVTNCIVPYCAALCCAVLCYAVLCFDILYCAVL